MTIKEYRKWFAEEFKDANKEQIKIIGISIFGANLGYLKSEKEDDIKSFKKDFDISEETYTDRTVLRYVIDTIQNHDNSKPYKILVGANGSEEKVLLEKPTLEEAVEKIKEIRKM